MGERKDAGLKSQNHYRSKLSTWRYALRELLIPLVRWETPYVAALQQTLRAPFLDSYFALTANLGTHSFYLVFLPVLFWCGRADLGRGLVHILAAGVLLSGFAKDLLCLPRPLSPPLQRITMSSSTALEYGFPSTHSTNAVSVAVFAIFYVHRSGIASSLAGSMLEGGLYFYAMSIVLGRLYCGMHGFLDVIFGGLLGAFISLVECAYIEESLSFTLDASSTAIIGLLVLLLVFIRTHPEPVDDCPCFDDSVAFAGVVFGIETGSWRFAQSPYAWNHPVPGTTPYSYEALGILKTTVRILLGVLILIAWRATMKRFFLGVLPPLYRVIEHWGLDLPRKFFTHATQYTKVPKHLKTDNVMPSVSDLPGFISNVRHPRRARSISIGPQSAADAYEALAFKEQRRRESVSAGEGRPTSSRSGPSGYNTSLMDRYSNVNSSTSAVDTPSAPEALANKTDSLAGGVPTLGTLRKPTTAMPNSNGSDTDLSPTSREEKEVNEMLSQIEKPRVRYDVEVVTKLIVYSGIGWLVTEVCPRLFYHLGMGLEAST